MNNKKNIVMITMLAVVAIMSIAYAFFATNLNITSTGSISSAWDVKFINITSDTPVGSASNLTTPSYTATTATMSADLKLPGDSITYRLTLKNNGDIPAIIEDINANATGSGAIIFSISGLNIGDKLAAKAEKVILVKIEYDPNVTSQPSETTKTLTVSIKAVQDTGQSITNQTPSIDQPLLSQLRYKILNDNVAQADTNIDFSKNSDGCYYDSGSYVCEVGSNGQGLYYTNVNTEDGATTYYFRGDVNNNYVKMGTYTTNTCTYKGVAVYYLDFFNGVSYIYNPTEEQCTSTTVCDLGTDKIVGADYDQCEFNGTDTGEYATYTENVTKDILWRIVRINEDGSVRLVTQDVIGSTYFNAEVVSNAGAGYMYGEVYAEGDNAYGLTHANNNPSTIKTYLDEWYTNNLSSYENKLSTEAGFCNDRSVAPSADLWSLGDTALGYGYEATYYGAYNRLGNLNQPQFKCPNSTRDLFTTSSSTKGNKKLTKPIGLLTADEAMYAGYAQYSGRRTSTYLDNGCFSYTMSPSSWFEGDMDVYAFGNLDLSNGTVYRTAMGVRPVINLKPTVELSTELPAGCTRLDGTEACPYIIETK